MVRRNPLEVGVWLSLYFLVLLLVSAAGKSAACISSLLKNHSKEHLAFESLSCRGYLYYWRIRCKHLPDAPASAAPHRGTARHATPLHVTVSSIKQSSRGWHRDAWLSRKEREGRREGGGRGVRRVAPQSIIERSAILGAAQKHSYRHYRD